MLRTSILKTRRAQFVVPQTWKLAYGRVDALTEIAWQDETIALIGGSSSALPLALSPSQRFVIIGEVWLSNHQALWPLAEKLAVLPKSDREWVALAWEHWGVETFAQLVGDFGLAVWDRAEQQLWLGRDRKGGRTLYYTTEASTTPSIRWIAPSLQSLNPHHDKTLDPIALRDYLACAYVPGEQTLWQGVRELRPGAVLSVPEQKHQFYWQLPGGVVEAGGVVEVPAQSSLQSHGQQLRTLLEQVVGECLPEQEPVGIFLSGGLDSSCVTALAAQRHNAPIHTYSIHFGEDCPNELEFSGLVAKHCETKHHILEVTFQQMWEQLPEALAWLDDPIGDPLTVPNLLLGQLAKESVSTILNGEGGDPCFGGPKNQPMLLNQLYGAIQGDRTAQRNGPSERCSQGSLQAYLLSYKKCAADLSELLKPEIWNAVRQEPSVFTDDLNAQASYLNRLMALNIKFKGADHILTKVSNLTQAAGLQGRSPLFDQRIVELSMQIPPEFKLSGVQEKAVLKAAVADLLPASIVYRPKSGMMVPVQLGFRKYWQKQARRLLLHRKAAIAPYINQELIRQWLDYRGDTWRRYGVKLWLLTSLELWLQVNGK